ncbi:MAG: 30S ribosome-binding factor RbfA [Chitinophagales bacterium]
MSSRRQLKIGRLLQETLGEIFSRKGADYYGRALVSIISVNVTPDLLLARVNVSIYNVDDKEAVVTQLTQNKADIKKQLGQKLRNHFRKMPQLEFYLDNTLEEADRLERILKDLDKGEEQDNSDQ